jgi:hypothetical protein
MAESEGLITARLPPALCPFGQPSLRDAVQNAPLVAFCRTRVRTRSALSTPQTNRGPHSGAPVYLYGGGGSLIRDRIPTLETSSAPDCVRKPQSPQESYPYAGEKFRFRLRGVEAVWAGIVSRKFPEYGKFAFCGPSRPVVRPTLLFLCSFLSNPTLPDPI